jgi:hypothetical protein
LRGESARCRRRLAATRGRGDKGSRRGLSATSVAAWRVAAQRALSAARTETPARAAHFHRRHRAHPPPAARPQKRQSSGGATWQGSAHALVTGLPLAQRWPTSFRAATLDCRREERRLSRPKQQRDSSTDARKEAGQASHSLWCADARECVMLLTRDHDSSLRAAGAAALFPAAPEERRGCSLYQGA